MSAAGHPHVAGVQFVPRFGQDAKFVIPSVDDAAAGQNMRRPTLPDEPGRSRSRQSRLARAICLAQNLDGSHERGGSRHTFEFERFEEGGRPAPNADIALAEPLIGVELLWPRQRLRLRDSRAETLPGNHRCNCPEGVMLGFARGDQGGANARIETDFLVDGFGVGLKGAGLPPLGLAEHRADQTIEQVDGAVSQTGGKIRGCPA